MSQDQIKQEHRSDINLTENPKENSNASKISNDDTEYMKNAPKLG